MLKESLEDVQRHLTETLRQLTADVAQFETLATQLTSSHRCWPSRWGWGGFLLLLAYAIFMHSFHSMSHEKTEARVETMRQEVAQVLEQMEQRVALLEAPPSVKKGWWQR